MVARIGIGRMNVGVAPLESATAGAVVITLDPMLTPNIKRRKDDKGKTVDITVNKSTVVEIRTVEPSREITVPTEGT